ncbi:hypothetical protein KAX75_02180 [candidate division WOR-3 bacterium]|nr:hypothetical protein [candidate division WOR-3 bacterium]
MYNMKKTIRFILIFLLLSICEISSQVIIFYTPDCEECYTILTDSLFEHLNIKDIAYYNINNIPNYEMLLLVEQIYRVRSDDFPIIVSGKKLFAGEEIIPNLAEIKRGADKLSLPDSLIMRGISEENPYWEDEIITEPYEELSKDKTYIAFFTKAACEKCDRTEKMLRYLQKKYPFLTIKTYDVLNRDNQVIQEATSISFNVPDNKRLIAPTIFICDTFLIENEITEYTIEKIISKNKNKKYLPPWEKGSKNNDVVSSKIAERFKNFGSLVVFIAGLVDGVNPCAFATIVFFLSFMTIIGRTRKEILITGITFVFVVFIVYLCIGIFLYRIIGLEFLNPVRYILYYAIAALAFALAIISIIDAVMLAKGKPEKSILRLPKVVKRRIERTIVKESKLRNYVVSAFISALIVSFLEFSCTGQVYIPTIFFVSGISGFRLKAILFLILYNLAFIIPLFLLFLIFVIGFSSEKLYSFMKKRAFLLKVATAVIFLALAISLILVR